MKNLTLLSLLVSLSLTSCGYRWQPDYPYRPTISIPFVEGDEDGRLTAEITHALTSSGLVDVLSNDGDYTLQITIQNASLETIGYRRDPQKVDGKVRKNLLACEGRRSLTVQACLYWGSELAFGPYLLSADADYDYVDGDSIQDLTFINPAGDLVTVLPFSLGQLESTESAQEATTTPLYSHIAQKIVDMIASEW